MSRHAIRFVFFLALSLVFAWLFMGYLLPIGLPFLLGLVLALAAEPAVHLLSRKLHFPRTGASAVAVSAVFLLSATVLTFLLALALRQSQQLVGIIPQLAQSITQAMQQLQQWLQELTSRLPVALQPLLTGLTEGFFSSGSTLLEQTAMQIPKLATGLLGSLSKGMLGLITGIISAYMISGRIPRLKRWWQSHQPERWQEKWQPMLRSLKKALAGWILAELKLAVVAFSIMLLGFWILNTKNALGLAAVITVVDAFPILGVGTVLVPWAIVCLLRQDIARGIGLLAIYAVVWLIRSILEPKLVGKGLGLDPLVTLIAIYAGWKLWGILGMLLAPILALTATQVLKQLEW